MKPLNNSFCSCRAVEPIIALFVYMLSVVLAIPAVYADTSPSMGAIYSGTNTSSEFNGSSQLVDNSSAPLEYITCPSSDYDYCWRGNYTYGSVTATAEIYVSDVKPGRGNVAVRPYMNAGVNSGSKLYIVTNKASWDAVFAQAACGENGCPGATELSPGKYYLLSSYGAYTDCPVFITWNKVTSGGYWVAAWTGLGWLGTGNCITVNYAPDIRVDSFVSPPAQVAAGNSVSFTVRIKNYGDQSVTKNVEAAILPTTWDSASLNYAPESSTDAAECCPANTYYNARSVTIAALTTEDVTFTVVAPMKTSIDNCDTIAPIRSAWGSSFIYRAGIYGACGEGYSPPAITAPGPTICTYDPWCNYESYDCDSTNTQVIRWTKDTLCGGGCGSLKSSVVNTCASGQYCYDTGTAYCKSCSTSCDGYCQTALCYGTDPDCTSTGGIKSCGGGGGGSCNGQITATVKDNNNAAMQGINIYVDDVPKGTTNSYGSLTASTTDSYCGLTHAVKATCSDGRYCASTTTVTNSNGDHDYVYFSCQTCRPPPKLLLTTTGRSSYDLNDQIYIEIAAKDEANAPVPGAYVRICDPFHEIGCPRQFSSGYTGSDGKIGHSSRATKLGAYTFDISASKDGYQYGDAEKTVTVGNFIGKIFVDVDDLSGSAISGAAVYLDGTSKGTTNSRGELTLYPSSSGSHDVKVNCPSGALCGTPKSVSVSGDVTASFDCDCTVPTGDLRVDVDNADGYPVANVYVVLDGTESADRLTNGFGTLYIQGISQGSHEVAIKYNVTNEAKYGIYKQSKTTTIGSGTNIVKFTATTDDAYKQTNLLNYSGAGAQPAVIPLVAAATEVVDIISIGIDIEEFCKCAYKADLGIKECIDALNSCTDINKIKDCKDRVRNNAIVKSGDCKLESALLIGDVATPFVPIGIVGHFGIYVGKELKTVDKFIPGSRVVFDKVEGVWVYTKKLGDQLIDYFGKWYDNLFRRYAIKGTEKWADDALQGMDSVAKKSVEKTGSKEAAQSFRDVLVRIYGDEYAQKIAAGIKRLQDKNIKGVDDAIKRIIDANGNEGNIRGVVFEIEVASDARYIDNVAEMSKRIPDVTDIDVLLKDGTIIEAKSGGYLNGLTDTEVKNELENKILRLRKAKNIEGLGDIKFLFKENIPQSAKDLLDSKVASGEITSWGFYSG